MKMPEPIGWGNHGQIDNINLGYAYIYPAEGTGAHRPVYDKQALFDLLEEAAVDMEKRPTWLTNIAVANLIRKMKEKL
jgi:hypothetical protein